MVVFMEAAFRTLNKQTSSVYPIIAALKSEGTRVFMVGGCVRDAILGRESKDIDIEVHGIASMEEMRSVLLEDGLFREDEIDEVGKAFGVLKVKCRGQIVDVSLPRREEKIGGRHTSFKVTVDPTLSLKAAAARRDFTMNALMFDTATGEIVDMFGGLEDIENKVIRHTSDAFTEDPLRVLRAVRFSATLGFTVAPETAQLCRTVVDEFQHLPGSRVWGEWEKIGRRGGYIALGMSSLVRTGWEVHFSQITVFAGIHADAVRDRAEGTGDNGIIVLAGLACATSDPIGFCKSIYAPNALMQMVRKFSVLVSENDQYVGLSVKAVNNLARRLTPYTIRQFSYVTLYSTLRHFAERWGCADGPIPSFVNGDDLAERGVKPGEPMGQILQQMIGEQDERLFTTREGALVRLDEVLAG